ncbi:4'-phosphopantetheinyl transferase family protein [Aliikangiella maris]|uniref:4'-phosphopantetheinyl transferase superfamily protein n=2 Tax=Aliikangiella maris TaxID=3162458 RepID=A0ABV2BUH0_9GAMM
MNIDNFLTWEKFEQWQALSGQTTIRCRYQKEVYDDSYFTQLNICMPETLQSAVTKRKAEYLAGRFAAKKALACHSIFEQQILTGKDRSPIWPTQLIGSITHTNSNAFCIVAPKENYHLVGIDTEDWIAEKTYSNIKKSIITEQEHWQLEQLSFTTTQAFTLAFSAKESLFKALYPSVQKYFDFMAAKIIRVDESNATFVIELTKDLNGLHCQQRQYQGQYQLLEGSIVTLIIE